LKGRLVVTVIAGAEREILPGVLFLSPGVIPYA
jgi:hypothetical protein